MSCTMILHRKTILLAHFCGVYLLVPLELNCTQSLDRACTMINLETRDLQVFL
jgi:hypothetical protein